MKIVNVDERHRIAVYDGNYVVQELLTKKKHPENTRWVSVGFFPSIGQACLELLDTLPSKTLGLESSLKDVVMEVRAAGVKLEEALKNL